MSFDAVQAVLPDIVQPRSPAVAPFPYGLMARLKDNVYILCVVIPDRYVPSVRRLLEVFLDCLYRIPLKWEPEGPVVAWCCPHILCGPHRGIGLLRKGVTWDLMAKGPERVEWSKWLPKTALNARMVMSAYIYTCRPWHINLCGMRRLCRKCCSIFGQSLWVLAP